MVYYRSNPPFVNVNFGISPVFFTIHFEKCFESSFRPKKTLFCITFGEINRNWTRRGERSRPPRPGPSGPLYAENQPKGRFSGRFEPSSSAPGDFASWTSAGEPA